MDNTNTKELRLRKLTEEEYEAVQIRMFGPEMAAKLKARRDQYWKDKEDGK